MATWQDTLTADTRTKAGVTAWISQVHAAMLAVGCVQTDDTGQLDIDSYPDPDLGLGGGVAVPYGYRIYELNDSLSASEPVYIKLEFVGKRHGAAGSLIGETLVTVGFSTDGAGGMDAPVAAALTPHTGYTTSNTQNIVSDAPCYACKVDGFLCVAVGIGYTRYSTSTHQTATFFALSRHGASVTLYHAHNSNVAGSGSYTELVYTAISRDTMTAVGPRGYAMNVPVEGAVGGLVVGIPATVIGTDAVWTDNNVITVRRGAVTENAPVALSLDDVTDRTYLVLPGPFAGSTAGTEKRLDFVADTRDRYNSIVAVRWE
jgi:hypothetical protein